MSTIKEFFNYSKFEARALDATVRAVIPGVEHTTRLEIYDAIGLEKPSLVTAKLMTKKQRDETALPTVVKTFASSCFVHLFKFTLDAADWNGEDALILDITVTDPAAFVYKLSYQIKV